MTKNSAQISWLLTKDGQYYVKPFTIQIIPKPSTHMPNM